MSRESDIKLEAVGREYMKYKLTAEEEREKDQRRRARNKRKAQERKRRKYGKAFNPTKG